jgi:predicted GNAT family acetyltransferase
MAAVRDNTALSRFELDADDVTAVADYHLAGNVMTITHTEVPPRARNRGIASRLIEGMLVEARRTPTQNRSTLPFRRRLF